MIENILQESSQRLLENVNSALAKFSDIPEELWAHKPEGKWSKKEILGHLVDSAANNHIRFVRAQLADKTYVSFSYEQDFFVESQEYRNTDTAQLINLWAAYNRHLSYIMLHILPSKLKTTCIIGSSEPMKLSFLVKDYVDHLEHHLEEMYCR